MKLTDLDIIVTAPPAPGWGGRYWILTKLTTSNGIVGWGECYASSVGPKAMEAVIRDVFERYFLNENPENIERLFRRVYSSRVHPTARSDRDGGLLWLGDRLLGYCREAPGASSLGSARWNVE